MYVERNIRIMRNTHLIEDESSADQETADSSTSAKSDSEAVKTICYEDVTLLLLLNSTGIRDLLAIEVNLQYSKEH